MSNNYTTINMRPETKDRLLAMFNIPRMTQEEMLIRLMNETEELRKQNEILQDENERLRNDMKGGEPNG